METYWSLRWLLQETRTRLEAVVLRENLVRVQGLPLVARVSAAPTLEPGTLVRMEVTGSICWSDTFVRLPRNARQSAGCN